MTNQLFDLIKGQLTDQVMNQLDTQLGNRNRQQTELATTGALNTLIGALAKNIGKPGGAQSLFNAVERDHDGGGILDNLLGVLTGQDQSQSNRAMDGLGIMMHLLGDRTRGSVDMLSKMSGMDRNKSARLLITLAPVVLSALGKMKAKKKLDQGGLQNVIQDTVRQQHADNANPTMNLITRFLDQDNDGNVTDELAGMGMKLLGNLLRR
ncbi:MAG: DUF937 domain-containing protein [Bacteroidota bacterium]